MMKEAEDQVGTMAKAYETSVGLSSDEVKRFA